MLDLIIKNGQCYIDGELKDVAVAIKDGKISQIGQISEDAKVVFDRLKNHDEIPLNNFKSEFGLSNKKWDKIKNGGKPTYKRFYGPQFLLQMVMILPCQLALLGDAR